MAITYTELTTTQLNEKRKLEQKVLDLQEVLKGIETEKRQAIVDAENSFATRTQEIVAEINTTQSAIEAIKGEVVITE